MNTVSDDVVETNSDRAGRYLVMADRGDITISDVERAVLQRIAAASAAVDEKFLDGFIERIAATTRPVPRGVWVRRS